MKNISGNIKNKVLFVVSDVHGCYTALVEGLNRRGFDKYNPSHILVVNGDLFDKGSETIETFRYISSLPKERVVLIRGNHEDLFVQLLKKEYPDTYDFYNGTVRTFCDVAGVTKYVFSGKTWLSIKKKVLKSDMYKFISDLELWNDFYEIGRFIITHGFIPSKVTMDGGHIYDPLWRYSDSISWNEARWSNGPLWISAGFCKNDIDAGETFVLGHVETKYFPDMLGYEPDRESDDDIFFGKGIIGLDGHAYVTNRMNVLKLIVVDNTNVTIEYEHRYK